MTSSSKAVTDNTPPLSSAGNTGASELPSARLANSDNTRTSTPNTPKSYEPTKNGGTTGEKLRQHAEIAKVALKWLERHGLIKRYVVLSKDRKTVKEIRLVLSPSIWTESLDLRLLSDGTTVAEWAEKEAK